MDHYLYNAEPVYETRQPSADFSITDDEKELYSLQERLEEVRAILAPRERKVLELRFGLIDGCVYTLDEVAAEFNVTPERVRQIEAKALRKLRRSGSSKKLRDIRFKIDLDSVEPTTLFKAEEADEANGLVSFSAPYSTAYADSVESYKKVSPSMCCIEELELSTDSYEHISERDSKGVFASPSSTFRLTTNTASMGIMMNQIRSGRTVDMSQVRIEEVLNYFDYEHKNPEEKFGIYTELLPKGNDKKVLYIQVQAREEVREHQNIVLLLDVSGSMTDNAGITQAAVAAIISKLKPGDIFSLITYASQDQTIVKGYEIQSEEDRETLLAKLYSLEIYGCTYGSAGIETAYRIGEEYYHEGWSNQVILITDGDLNFGVTEKHGLRQLIEDKKTSNLFLSVIGTGLWNYKDDKLEALARHGNGTYCAVNTLEDAEESVNRRYVSLTNIIAKDVKAQVEFNPRYVKEYRLLGYENRELQHEDFKDDSVISEPYGSGGHGIALYELTMSDRKLPGDLKYQSAIYNDYDEICTVKIRYKEPLSDESSEISKVALPDEESGANVQLAYLLYCISEELRDSFKLDDFDKKYLDVMLTSGFNKEWLKNNGEKLTAFLDAYKKESDNHMLPF